MSTYPKAIQGRANTGRLGVTTTVALDAVVRILRTRAHELHVAKCYTSTDVGNAERLEVSE